MHKYSKFVENSPTLAPTVSWEALNVRAYLIAAALLLAILGSIGGYKALQISRLMSMDFSPPPVTIAAAVSTQENRSQHLNAVGTIRAVRGVELTSEANGEVTEINFDSGDEVKAGQLLLVLNDEVEQASHESQTATLELAQLIYERDRKLLQRHSVSQTQYDQSRADLARARAALVETEARIRNKHIHAPFDGTVGIRRVELGDYASPGTVIATLQDRSELDIDFTLPARHAPLLRTGLAVSLRVNAYPGREFPAEISAIDARVDPGTRNLLVRASIAESGGLLPGMFATLRIDLGRGEAVTVVPETAVTYSLQGNLVHVITEHEQGGLTAVTTVVQTGDVRDGKTAILSGLEPGERVVIAGQNKLFQGVKILIDEGVSL